MPKSPGVYFMRSQAGRILYIGKAKSLKARLSSYRLLKPEGSPKNIVELLKRVRKIDWELHPSEEVAFRRERELIRALVPTYNIADAWEEEYLFIGLRRPSEQRLAFRLSSREKDLAEFHLHGCYTERRFTKSAYSALLRLIYAAFQNNARFRFPAKLASFTPMYNYSLNIPDAKIWERRISDFLKGQKSHLVKILVDTLLKNEKIPPYVRPGLQRDIELLANFARSLKRVRKRLGAGAGVLSHQDLRLKIKASIQSSTKPSTHRQIP